MKKFIILMISAVIAFAVPAMALDIDLTELSYQELEELQTEVEKEVARREALKIPRYYEADFDTDSSVFCVHDKKYGRGLVTKVNNQMTIHVSLKSKSIVNLFPGTADEAEQEGAVWLEPTVDVIYYYSEGGFSEEVYGFDIPVPVIGEEFDVAICGTSGEWYDHKVKVSNLQEVVQEAAEEVEEAVEEVEEAVEEAVEYDAAEDVVEAVEEAVEYDAAEDVVEAVEEAVEYDAVEDVVEAVEEKSYPYLSDYKAVDLAMKIFDMPIIGNSKGYKDLLSGFKKAADYKYFTQDITLKSIEVASTKVQKSYSGSYYNDGDDVKYVILKGSFYAYDEYGSYIGKYLFDFPVRIYYSESLRDYTYMGLTPEVSER